MQDSKGRKRPTVRRQGRYGEKTVIRRVPLSVVPLLDFLLEQMARAAKNDPRRTLERVAAAVDKIADEEQERDDFRETQSRVLTPREARNKPQNGIVEALQDVLTSEQE